MPYIDNATRRSLDSNSIPLKIGELNYVITKVCLGYLTLGELNYQAYNEIIGVLECAKLEMYRRRVAAYEDQKCAQNGDVY